MNWIGTVYSVFSRGSVHVVSVCCSHQKLDSFCQAELEKENNRLKADVDRHKKKIGEANCLLPKLFTTLFDVASLRITVYV